MQFRKAGNRIQVLAYRGYDNEKKRAIVKMLGSFDAFSYSYPDDLTADMSEEEKLELAEYIENHKKEKEADRLNSAINYLKFALKNGINALDKGAKFESESGALVVWEDVIALQKALRKAGYPKPKKQQKPTAAKVPEGQESLNLS